MLLQAASNNVFQSFIDLASCEDVIKLSEPLEADHDVLPTLTVLVYHLINRLDKSIDTVLCILKHLAVHGREQLNQRLLSDLAVTVLVTKSCEPRVRLLHFTECF